LLRIINKLFLVAAIFIPVVLSAQTFEEGMAAYQEKDYQKAHEILLPLAEQGNSQAQITLGIMYENGQGVAKDPSKALDWYIKAASQGIPVVQHDVGVKFFKGIGARQDYLQAAKWWRMAADAGLSDSQFNLGLMYYRGLGVGKDLQEARELFQHAAEQGHSHAQYSLAVMYAFGQGVEKDYAQALTWFQKSANQGVAQAQYNLGIFYENGYALEKDEKKAREWYRKAADQGLPEARQKLARLGDRPAEGKSSLPATEMPSIDKREDWALSQPATSYTLQLASLLSETDALKFIQSHNIESNSAYIRVIINDVVRFNVIYGNYSSFENAKNAIKSLPTELQQQKPWVRNMGLLQNLIVKNRQ